MSYKTYEIFLLTLLTNYKIIMAKENKKQITKKTQPASKQTQSKKLCLKWRKLPVAVIVFVLLWMWASLWMGDVFIQVRENSFFAASSLLMQWELSQNLGWLWTIGRAMLMLFRWPLLGGMILALMLIFCCWLLSYVLRLPARWRWIGWLPVGLYTGIFTYQGYSNWYQAETGHEFAIPLVALVILLVVAVVERIIKKTLFPALVRVADDEKPLDNALQLLVGVLMIAGAMVYGEKYRAYVRPTAKMQTAVMNGDWEEVIQVAHDNDDMSVRPMAANYAIALVQTHQLAEHLFDIRFDYDSVYVQGNGSVNPPDMYDMECDYYAGLVEPAYHQAMNLMVMSGPSIRTLKMLCKTAMLRSEWAVAERYLDVLDNVPFEGGFCEQWRSYLHNPKTLNKNPEVAVIRGLEPLHDDMENNYQMPLYLSYNQKPRESRTRNGYENSMMANIYSKSLLTFIDMLEPLVGTSLPKNISEAALMVSEKYTGLRKAFPSLEYGAPELDSFYQQAGAFMGDYETSESHARELFPSYKGYYPYYYYFGNLRDTNRSTKSSNNGVN